jgi:hypothetical protein
LAVETARLNTDGPSVGDRALDNGPSGNQMTCPLSAEERRALRRCGSIVRRGARAFSVEDGAPVFPRNRR